MSKENNKPELKAVPSGEATVLTEFKKKENLSVIFRPHVVEAIKYHYAAIGEPKDAKFLGPDFKDVAGYQIKGPFLVVHLRDDTQYIYPLEDIARIKTYITTE